ncbi:MAG: HAMP domain-containing protein [Chloroflexi bacterium]|nr:HAMP domain-containing protein [Chloroflexota bacterium]
MEQIQPIQGRQTLSIRYALPLAFVGLIVVVFALIGLLAFSSGQVAVDVLTRQLAQEISTQIEQHVFNYIENPHLLLDINAAAYYANDLDVSDQAALERLFLQQVQVEETVSFFSFGSEQGDFVAVEEMHDGFVVRVRDETTAPVREEYRLETAGDRSELIRSSEYDPRDRGWYQTAVSTGGSAWSNIYQIASRSVLAISPVKAIYDQHGDTVGVFGTILTLSQINTFLNELEISDNGQAFIMERNGFIVASSVMEPSFVQDENGEQTRLLATQSSNSLIESSANQVAQRFSEKANLFAADFVFTTEDDERQHVQVNSIHDEYGLDWLIVVAIPESDFTGPLTQRINTTIQIALVAMFVAAFLGIVTARWIIRPVLAVSDAATAVEAQEFDLPMLKPVMSRGDEMGKLARVFQRMVQEVKAREEKLKQQVKRLKIEIDQAKSNKRVQEIVESDFFKGLETSSNEMRRRRKERRERKNK